MACAQELPEAVTAQIKASVPDATVMKVKRRKKDHESRYRIDVVFKDGRKGRLEIEGDGTLHKLKVDFRPGTVLPGVLDTAGKLFPHAVLDRIRRVLLDEKPAFEIRFRIGDRKALALLRPDGTLVRQEVELNPESLPEAVKKIVAKCPFTADIATFKCRTEYDGVGG